MRNAAINRNTRETNIELSLNIDGQGNSQIQSGVGFFDHMLDLFCVHSLMDIDLSVKGDLEIDAHHTVEDVGICLGKALFEAKGEAKGIHRYASMILPMDESLVQVAVDFSNRPFFSLQGKPLEGFCGVFDAQLTSEFFRSVVNHAHLNLHIKVNEWQSLHHAIEAVFKATAICFRKALEIDPRRQGVPSSKGVL